MQKLFKSPVVPPFAFIPPRKGSSVLFTSPHSGRHYPEAFLKQTKLSIEALRRVEDAYVDVLVDGVEQFGAGCLLANYPRSYVDLNRARSELDSRMFVDGPPTLAVDRTARLMAGYGCIPKLAAGGEDIYDSQLRRAEASLRLETVYDPFHDCLESTINGLDQKTGHALLIDCHSMPSRVNGQRLDADIVLGTRHGKACDETLVDLIERSFAQHGYKVIRNLPYAGGYLTEKYGRPSENQNAVQIEFNRALYLDESRTSLKDEAESVQSDFMSIANDIENWAKKSRAS